jgi:large subunit ribosomal protein L21
MLLILPSLYGVKTTAMYAIVETGGKQYRASPGEILQIEHLKGDVGMVVTFGKVLFFSGDSGNKLGTPAVDNASVSGSIVEQGRSRTVTVFKKKRRKNYRRTKGHRQSFTKVRITDILGV